MACNMSSKTLNRTQPTLVQLFCILFFRKNLNAQHWCRKFHKVRPRRSLKNFVH